MRERKSFYFPHLTNQENKSWLFPWFANGGNKSDYAWNSQGCKPALQPISDRKGEYHSIDSHNYQIIQFSCHRTKRRLQKR